MQQKEDVPTGQHVRSGFVQLGILRHDPVSGLHESTVQTSWSSHFLDSLTHPPVAGLQESFVQLLSSLQLQVPALIEQAHRMQEDDIGSSLPGLAFASMHHETQYTRLFRS